MSIGPVGAGKKVVPTYNTNMFGDALLFGALINNNVLPPQTGWNIASAPVPIVYGTYCTATAVPTNTSYDPLVSIVQSTIAPNPSTWVTAKIVGATFGIMSSCSLSPIV
jgi:hypothetical protein